MGGRSSSVGVSSPGPNWGQQARLARLRLRVGVSLGGQEDDLDQAPVAGGVGGLQYERDPADLDVQTGLLQHLPVGAGGRALPWSWMATRQDAVAVAVAAP